MIAALIAAANLLFAQQMTPGGWSAAASSSITGRIVGEITDGQSGTPIDYASVVLIKVSDGKEADGTVSDEKGSFKFPSVKLGKYNVHVSFVGYQPMVISNVELTPTKPDVSLDRINLSPLDVVLETVTVKGEAALYENKVDRIVYNAEKDVTLGSGDATDVLRKVPLLSVDLDGNVSLRGSTNIKILINGKPSGMFSNNLADALKMFPADQIKSVEVLTVPSAKYEGEGSAGIINIITKKKQVDGYTANINIAPGDRQSTMSANLNAAKGRFGVNGGGFGVWSPNRDGNFTFERTDTIGSSVRSLIQNGVAATQRVGFHGSFGAYYDINAYNSINSNISFRGFGFDREGITTARFSDPSKNWLQESSRNSLSETLNSGFDWNTDYRRTFPNSEKEFSMGVQLSGNQDDAMSILNQSGNFDYLLINEKGQNDGNNLETTLQVDYIYPFSKKLKLETGLKGVFRSIDSDFRFDTLNAVQQTYARDASRSDEFNYGQDVYSAYTSLTWSFADVYGLVAGMRYERTNIIGNYLVSDTEFTNDYDNLLPSIILSRKMNQFSNIRLSYNKRIQRPSLRFINPYVNQEDRNNISFGNPEISPELTDNVELAYNTFVKGVVMNGSIYYRHTEGIIQNILSVDAAGISRTTFDNVGNDNSVGLNFFVSGTLKKIFQLRGNVDIRRVDVSGIVAGKDASNQGFEFNGNVGSTLTLPWDMKMEVFAMLRSPRVTLQGSQATFWMYNLGLQKDIFGKRGSVGIRIANLFHKSLNFSSDLSGNGFRQYSNFEFPFRSYSASFSYRFGKLDFKSKERRSKVNNNDQKAGEERNF